MEKKSQYQPEELIPIVAQLVGKLTGGESTSITYERAQQLMEAVLYCINEWEQEQAEGSESQIVDSGRKVSAEEAYKLGLACVTKKVKMSLALYNRIMEQFDAYGNQCLYDTMVKGMPEFFRHYDARFEPQNTILTLEYPVVEDIREYTGVDAIWEYLCCIRAEQKYLGRLPRNFVIDSLKSYCADYDEMIENLRQIVDEYSNL